jgi:hypothetical protein
LSLLHLGFLQTEEIGIELTENIAETLTLARTQTIYIPTNKLHTLSFLGAKLQIIMHYAL